jgi:hypothetical protein
MKHYTPEEAGYRSMCLAEQIARLEIMQDSMKDTISGHMRDGLSYTVTVEIHALPKKKGTE